MSSTSIDEELKVGDEQRKAGDLHRAKATTPPSNPDNLRTTLGLCFTSLGIIYGDLGTSPLYVMDVIFPASSPQPSEQDVIGAISAILWTLIILPGLMYSGIALHFGNGAGEGGPMAMYSSLYPRNDHDDADDNRSLTTYPTLEKREFPRVSLFERKWVRGGLFTWVCFGTSLTISDGLLTPAVSVVSAVQGIAVAVPSVSNNIVPISVAILVVLFGFQALGTQRVGLVFAPIITVWMLIIGVSGCINIVAFPGILRAFDPSRAVMWFVRNKNFDDLGGVLLCITGVEAMLANLGQFSKRSIRLGFVGFVLPSLLVVYLGQGARLIADGPDVLSNVFYATVPGGVGSGFWWITFVISILAAVIASQSMISATFSLTQQLVHYHALPAIKIIHTSSYFSGQVYVPVVNGLLFLGTIAYTVGFGTSSGLTNAYGFAVATVLIVTTTFVGLSMVRIKGLPWILVIAFLLAGGFINSLFWVATLKKVPTGAYAPLAVGIVLTSGFFAFSWARGLEDSFDANNRHRLTDIIMRPVEELKADETKIVPLSRVQGQDGVRLRIPVISAAKGKGEQPSVHTIDLQRLPVFALFHNAAGNLLDGAPHSFAAFVRAYPALPQVTVFFSVLVLRNQAYMTEDDERLSVSRVRSFKGIYVCKYRVGYRDNVDLTNVPVAIRDRIVRLEALTGDDTPEFIFALDSAISQSVTHIVPRFYVSAKKTGKWTDFARRFLLEVIYRRVQSDDTAKFVLDEDTVLRIAVSCKL